ncbi:N-acetylmuramoyl-L-alanine amidase family protein [Sporohalobacter salinus]|uniref:N-acetylmuramoyl-L-alanine amidase family protein n=1 Tax=Sporohalobacter salinus TaxID=1494606 RepID=UPI001961A184|nr:N-acetylmuramoyl-L-alanine amidase family protein [Sporohalobacter salinus]MBM7622690.1 N-acetylmuramoyl-L-alanine amidase [Sporohalobacter salinus]
MLNQRRLIILFTLLVLICYILPVFASNMMFKAFINDKLIESNLKVKQEGENLLVPVGILADGFDLKVEWKNLIKTVNIKFNDKLIKLRVGENKAQIGDRVKRLSSQVKLEEGKVLIPVDFMSEILGYKVSWDDNTLHFFKPSSKVKEITYENQKAEGIIKIKTTKQPDYEINQLTNPDRLVIDIHNSRLVKGIEDIAINNGLIFQIRSGQFKTGVTRIVLDLYQPLDYKEEVIKKGKNHQLILKMNPQITNFKYDSNKGLFSISATDELTNYETKFIKDDKKMIVKFPNMTLDVVEDEFEINSKLVESVNLSQFEEGGASIVKVSFKVNKWFELNIKKDPKDNNRLLLRPQRRVGLVSVDYDSQEGEVKIKTEQPVTSQAVPLEKGDRLVVDFPNTVFRNLSQNISVKDDFIEEIRIAQFNKDIARTVIDLKELVNYELENRKDKKTGDYITVVNLDLPNDLKSKPNNNTIVQETDEEQKQLKAVDIKQQGLKTELQVKLNNKSNYQIKKFTYPDRIVIDIPGTNAALKPTEIAEPKGIIKDVRVSQFSRDPMTARVVFELPYTVDYQVSSKDKTDRINIKFKENVNQNDLNLTGKTIMVDAGHGGADPGAIGPDGTMEKDVNLNISKRLAALLREAGANVKMSRKSDKYITLWDRTNEANKLNCDIFVSIHANSHKRNEASGIETYVYPGSYGDTLVLAKKVQNTLYEKVKLPNRGVRFENLYVLENTNMPSILVEVGFLSNRKEEKLLNDPEFRQKSAQGIYKGIIAFFNRK